MVTLELHDNQIQIEGGKNIFTSDMLGLSEEDTPALEFFVMDTGKSDSAIYCKNITSGLTFLLRRVINPFTFAIFQTTFTNLTFRIDGRTSEVNSVIVSLENDQLYISSHSSEPLIIWIDIPPMEGSIKTELFDQICVRSKPVVKVLESDYSEWQICPWRMELWEEE